MPSEPFQPPRSPVQGVPVVRIVIEVGRVRIQVARPDRPVGDGLWRERPSLPGKRSTLH